MKKITQKLIEEFKIFLISEEKSDATVDKYIRDTCTFSEWLCERNVDKTAVLNTRLIS